VTFDERVQAIVKRRFTPRQARFLVMVMLHSGVCMRRQYCAFARIVHGHVDRLFFERMTAEKIATAFDAAHHRARIYHVRHRALYRAIGEPHSRHRKPLPLARAVEHLMLLDAVLARPEVTWLATERDKLAHFSHRVGNVLQRDEFPQLVFGDAPNTTTRYFPDGFPIGVEAEHRGYLFVYLVTREIPIDFRPFLLRHAELLRALPHWTIQLLVPTHLATASETYSAAAWEELAEPLRPQVVDELRWFFREQRRLSSAGEGAQSVDPSRYGSARQAFSAPRYRVLYRTWMRVGDRAISALASRVLRDALERQTGRIESIALPRPYLHLSSLVGTA
jgi:hypothetical protein